MEEEIKLLKFREEEKDLYTETMKLINKEIDEKQFIKDHIYYRMVKSIYINNLKKLGNINHPNNNLLNIYVDNATDTYNKLRDLNKYVGYDFKPFDDELIYYISTQYINYFNINDININETEYSLAEKISGNIKEYKHHPFKRIESDTYHVEELDGINIYLNDLIYKSLKKNKDIINNIDISNENLINIRQGNVELNKDILYMMFLGLQLSKYEIEKFIDKRLNKYLSFDTKRDKTIIKIINDINAFKNADTDNNSLLEITNNLLEEKGYEKLDTTIKVKEKDNNNKTILLIGGLGFIGRECIKYFKDYNYKICVLVNHIPTSIPEDVICYQGDITNKLVYERILSENNVDYIIDLAAISTVKKGNESFEETMMINEQAPNALYSSILDNDFKVKCVIFPSTTLVYQGIYNENEICSEESLIIPERISNDYAFSKYQAEQNSLRYARRGLPIIITRLSNIYGIEDNNQRLIPSAIKALEKGKEANLYVDIDDNNKTALINLVYIKDLLDAFNKIFEVTEIKPITYKENIIVNIANENEYYVKEILEKIYELYDREFNPNIIKTKIGNNKIIDTSKAYKLFNFKSNYDLEDGLKDMLNKNNKTLVKRR